MTGLRELQKTGLFTIYMQGACEVIQNPSKLMAALHLPRCPHCSCTLFLSFLVLGRAVMCCAHSSEQLLGLKRLSGRMGLGADHRNRPIPVLQTQREQLLHLLTTIEGHTLKEQRPPRGSQDLSSVPGTSVDLHTRLPLEGSAQPRSSVHDAQLHV